MLPPHSHASLRPLLKTASGCTTFHSLSSARDVSCGSCSCQQACRRHFRVDEQCEGCTVLTELRREALGVTSLQSTSHPDARGLCSCPTPPARGRFGKEQALAARSRAPPTAPGAAPASRGTASGCLQCTAGFGEGFPPPACTCPPASQC